MAQSASSNPQLVEDKLSKVMQDILSEETSLIDLCLPLPASDETVANVTSPLGPVLDVAEGDAATDSDVSFGKIALDEHKGGLRISVSSEWQEDSVPAGVKAVMNELAKRNQDYSDGKIASLLKASVSIPESTVASLNDLALSDIWDAVATLRYSRDLPAIHCNHQVFAHLKTLEASAGLYSEVGTIMGLPYIPSSLGSVDQSGDLLLSVGQLSKEVCVVNYGVRVAVDSQSSVSNALNDMLNVISFNRFRLGAHGNGSGLATVKVA